MSETWSETVSVGGSCSCVVDLSHVAPWPSGTLSGMTSAGPEPEDIKSVVRELVLHVMMLATMVENMVWLESQWCGSGGGAQ